MRSLFSIAMGIPALIVFVLMPALAQALTKTALNSHIDAGAKAALLYRAHEIDKCDTQILDKLGTLTAQLNKFDVSVWAFGQAMVCQPGSALFRAKYAAAMVGNDWDGAFAMREATILEPHNPLYKREAERLTKPQ